MNYKKLWLGLIAVIVGSFAVLGYYGIEIYREAPPIPAKVVSASGKVIFTVEDIQDGQNVWQSTGGQQLGSIWGHGAYIAPDWSADWLHKEAMYLLNTWAQQEKGVNYEGLDEEGKAMLEARLQKQIRANTYDPETGVLTISDLRAAAIADVSKHYTGLFMNDPALAKHRYAYAMKNNTVSDPVRMQKLNAFFFWTSWACVTERPGKKITYTNNWPAEKLVANEPSSDLIIWTGFSVIVLIAGVGLLVYYYASNKEDEIDHSKLPKKDPLLGLNATPSMKATLKYFWIVTALILVQVTLGIVSAHYGVEGQALYGFPLADYMPYSITRTWHVQLAIFWIATSWLATGLYIAPAVSGYEPKFQKLGVNFLFVCLLIIVAGSLAGQWYGVMQKLGYTENFWFGHQGYEYVDLGRFWQVFLLVGLFVWLALMVRAIMPAYRNDVAGRHLLGMFLISSAAIALFYAAGMMWGQHSNLAIAEYWRWWVVHLWVEGFFEVFATVVIAFLFVRMGLLDTKIATNTVLFSTIIFLLGGILGTFHHLYFSGTPTAVMALGATFSALEVVPLVLIGFEAYHHLKISKVTQWIKAYKWPIYCFVAVAFWNMLGAGVFGFVINPPIALYYMQGLNTTPVHAHTALFGVYGILGIGLMLFVLKGVSGRRRWKDGTISFAFWSLNVGLILMVLISVLPIGILQTWASVEHGLWYARSMEFMQTDTMNLLRWLRVVGDTIFAGGIVALAWYIIGLKTGWSLEDDEDVQDIDLIEAQAKKAVNFRK